MSIVQPQTEDDWWDYATEHRLPFLYTIYAEGTDYYKVGFSRDPQRRLNQVQGLAPQPLTLIGAIPAMGASAEALVHRRLRGWRHRGEWFNLHDPAYFWGHQVGRTLTPWEVVRLAAGFQVVGPDGHAYVFNEEAS